MAGLSKKLPSVKSVNSIGGSFFLFDLKKNFIYYKQAETQDSLFFLDMCKYLRSNCNVVDT